MTYRNGVVLKTETRGIPASKILCVSVIVLAADSPGELFHFTSAVDDLAGIVQLVALADLIVTHSMHYINAVEREFPAIIFDRRKVYDTMKEGKRLFPDQRPGLDAWAARFGGRRWPMQGGTDTYGVSMGEHCDHDARIVEFVHIFLVSDHPV